MATRHSSSTSLLAFSDWDLIGDHTESGYIPQKARIHIESELIISVKCINLVALGAFFEFPYKLSVPIVNFHFLKSS